jgi:hypothetical protein
VLYPFHFGHLEERHPEYLHIHAETALLEILLAELDLDLQHRPQAGKTHTSPWLSWASCRFHLVLEHFLITSTTLPKSASLI